MGERPGFDGIRKLKSHAGIDAHRNESQIIVADYEDEMLMAA